ncbi:MAG: zeta toxin family protein [Phycisphaerae bacterium]|nr:zeta toxin family protein [Phycisphaerae bacterium]
MSSDAPHVIVLAGPNGSGKSTTAPALLHGMLGVDEFVNADVIARGLSGFSPERAALEAGAVMLARLHELAKQRCSFAFETTLASRTPASWLKDLIETGYRVHLVFLWLPSAAMAIRRVASRVRAGGHSIPDETVRRRYDRGLRNFFTLYQPLATTWQMRDSSSRPPPRLVAAGRASTTDLVIDMVIWQRITRDYDNEG